ncbi:MAG: ribonuclease HII [Patescibacteria group bacterium]|nr:ribonuclease HII [Patescibacteria group bacterium]
MRYPNFSEERKLLRKGYKRVVGIDEVGRGPLAGPVMAAAVIIDSKFKFQNSKLEIKDSKKLTPRKREELYKILTNHPQIKWGIGRVSEKVIDRINILEATKLAMERAVKNLDKRHNKQADFLILDGNFKINTNINQKSIIRADNIVLSCSVASIIAKVTRDRVMQRYDKKHPQYGFSRHKGYATRLHLKMLKKYSFCPIHRVSFKPVKRIKEA